MRMDVTYYVGPWGPCFLADADKVDFVMIKTRTGALLFAFWALSK